MSKVLVIPELHIWDKNMVGRIDYVGEISSYMSRIRDEVTELCLSNEDVYVIFPGDLFHRSYVNMSSFVFAVDWCQSISNLTHHKLYSVIGNHELTFYKDNPFWLMADSTSEYYQQYKLLAGYNTIKDCIKVVDELVVDNTLFVFGHYRRDNYTYDYETYDDVQFISHNPVMDLEMCNVLTNSYGRNPDFDHCKYVSVRDTNSLPVSEKLSHVYFGHMHTAHSRFNLEERLAGCFVSCQLRYMGSLGRTNCRDVKDDDCDRELALIDTLDHSVTDIPFELIPRDKCVQEDIVAHNHAKYDKGKAIRHLKSSNTFMVSPLEGIRSWLAPNATDLAMFDMIYQAKPLEELDTLILQALGED